MKFPPPHRGWTSVVLRPPCVPTPMRQEAHQPRQKDTYRSAETVQTNGASSLDAMAEQPNIRVLFTDIQMPGMLDGIQLARRVHEQWPDVLLLTPALGSCISPAAS
jgi:DNA-binding NarL/FixJ family response regulator